MQPDQAAIERAATRVVLDAPPCPPALRNPAEVGRGQQPGGAPAALVTDLGVKKAQRGEPRREAGEQWAEPIPFVDRIPTPFPENLIPGFLGDMVTAVSQATETPFELPAMLGLAVASACVARKVIVCPEQGYTEPVNLYVAVGMESGNRKTAVLNHMTRPFFDWEQAEAERVKPERNRLTSERKTIEARIKKLREKAAASDQLEALKGEITELERSLPEVPPSPRLWVQDITPEQLGVVMAEQGERIALLSDEGGIFDTLAGRYSNNVPNLDLFLQGHSGFPVRVDRVGRDRPPVWMQHPALTVGISPQPDVLQNLSDKPGFRGRGLLARFLYALPPSPLGYRTLDPRPIPPSVEQEYNHGITELLKIEAPEDCQGNPTPWVLRFPNSAYSAWKDFQREIEKQMREGERLYRITDWAAKLAGAAARVAGVLHCVQYAGQSLPPVIEEAATESALSLAAILTSHALAVFGLMERDPMIEDAEKILRWIHRTGKSEFSLRECFCAHQSRFGRVDAIAPVIHLLEQHMYMRRRESGKQGSGRPSQVFEVNPAFLTEGQ